MRAHLRIFIGYKHKQETHRLIKIYNERKYHNIYTKKNNKWNQLSNQHVLTYFITMEMNNNNKEKMINKFNNKNKNQHNHTHTKSARRITIFSETFF